MSYSHTHGGQSNASGAVSSHIHVPALNVHTDNKSVLNLVDHSANGDLRTIEDVVSFLEQNGQPFLSAQLYHSVNIHAFDFCKITVSLPEETDKSVPHNIGRALTSLTKKKWVIAVENVRSDSCTLAQRDTDKKHQLIKDLSSDPWIETVMEQFPGAVIHDVTDETQMYHGASHNRKRKEVEL